MTRALHILACVLVISFALSVVAVAPASAGCIVPTYVAAHAPGPLPRPPVGDETRACGGGSDATAAGCPPGASSVWAGPVSANDIEYGQTSASVSACLWTDGHFNHVSAGHRASQNPAQQAACILSKCSVFTWDVSFCDNPSQICIQGPWNTPWPQYDQICRDHGAGTTYGGCFVGPIFSETAIGINCWNPGDWQTCSRFTADATAESA